MSPTERYTNVDETTLRHLGALAAESNQATPADQQTLANQDITARSAKPPLVFLHGLSFDHRQWDPVIRELASADPGRQAITFDLPGHGGSAPRDSYDVPDLTKILHEAVTDAGITAPVVVGHSFGGVLATEYGATYPARGVVNVDQPLRSQEFAAMLRKMEPGLRGPDYEHVWQTLFAGMHVEYLSPDAQRIVRETPPPSQQLLLGYWRELLEAPSEQLAERTARNLTALRSSGMTYLYIAGAEPSAAYLDWLRSALPDVAVTVFPGTGHFPHLARHAELARLLASIPSDGQQNHAGRGVRGQEPGPRADWGPCQ
jgi:pimeloyl-ACP methyl ester carboxylesterase